jgi:multicomponent K+:H+ antiporter subunit A
MGSMLGIVLSENILQIVFFWELTSLSSFLLISFWQYKKDGRDGAMMALVVTGAGGLALFASMLILGNMVGSYELSVVLQNRDIIVAHPLFTPMFILFILGVLTKSAQFPFHFWLPHAMAAPTPVSAYLHSATMVKAGIFLLARFFPVFSGTAEWMIIVTTVGVVTLLVGAFFAFFKDDLKALLAYSTVSHLGLITLLFGFSTPLAAQVAVFHIINHATFKAALFMIVGIVDHETKTRDLKKLGGLFSFMPHVATLSMICAASMAGIPPFNGFISKEMIMERAVVDGFSIVVPVLLTLAGGLAVGYSIRFVCDLFFGQKTDKLDVTPHEPVRAIKLPIDLLALGCVIVGLIPMLIVYPLLQAAVFGVLQTTPPEVHLSLWHGFNIPLLMSFLAVLMGIIMYWQKKRLFTLYDRYLSRIDARVPYNLLIESMFKVAKKIDCAIHKGRIHDSIYAFIISTFILGIFGFTIYGNGELFGAEELLGITIPSVIIVLMLFVTVLSVILLHRQRLISLVIIGVVGLIVSLIFFRFSAPDLALTQISVELVTIVLVLLALYYLPPFSPKESSKLKIASDAFLAIIGGIGAFVLAVAVMSREYNPISNFFIENSKSGGGGTNVVNVILVDFRALDTMGEIVVLGIAGIGIFAVLQGLRLHAPSFDARGFNWSKDSHPLIMKTITGLMLPIMLLVAVYIFLRGHNLPGGGFIAGLIAAVALIVQYLAGGIEWSSKRLNFDKHFLIGSGVLIAALTGVVSMILGYPFLTSAFTYLNWPIVGKFEVASAIAFDIGVFLVVVGATVMILVELGKVNMKSHKLSERE